MKQEQEETPRQRRYIKRHVHLTYSKIYTAASAKAIWSWARLLPLVSRTMSALIMAPVQLIPANSQVALAIPSDVNSVAKMYVVTSDSDQLTEDMNTAHCSRNSTGKLSPNCAFAVGPTPKL